MASFANPDVPIFALPPGESLLANTALGVLAAASLLYCLQLAVRQRRLYPLYVFIGGSLGVCYEFLTDVLGHVAWATQSEIVVARIFGRELPLYAYFVYMLYFPAAILLVIRRLDQGMSLCRWWAWSIAGIPLTCLFELYPLHQRWWVYYGANQPLPIGGFPLYWAFVNSMTLMSMAALNHLLLKNFLGAKHTWVLVFSIPVSLICVHMPVVFPAQSALNSTWSLVVTIPASLATIALSLALLQLLGRLVARTGQAEPARTISAL
jgi:hypothetical protein